MSKKVLNYAGKRPMLLALIMATLTLGLLFSGWLTPTPSKAEGTGGGDPPTRNENTNNCPNYVTNLPTVVCPSVTNNGALLATDFCVNQGDAVPPWPTLVASPGASLGQIINSTTETCSGVTTYTTNNISYSFSGLKYRDGNGPPDGNSSPNRYWANYYVTVSSSDTNCPPNPSEILYGTVSWTVVSTNVYKVVFDPAKAYSALIQAASLAESAASVAGCSGTNFSVSGRITNSWQYVCCNTTNGPYKKSSVSGALTIGLPTLKCPIPGLSIALPGSLSQYGQLGVFFNYNGSATFSGVVGVAQPCQETPICLNGSVNQSIGASVGGRISLPSGWFQCGIDATGGFTVGAAVNYTGPDASGNCNLSGKLGSGTLKYSVSVEGGGFSCTLLSDSVTLWDGVNLGPVSTGGCICF